MKISLPIQELCRKLRRITSQMSLADDYEVKLPQINSTINDKLEIEPDLILRNTSAEMLVDKKCRNTNKKKKKKQVLALERVADNLSKARIHELSSMVIPKKKAKKLFFPNKVTHLRNALDRDLKNQTKSLIVKLFQSKVSERIAASIKIMKKKRKENNVAAISVIHAVLLMELRVVEGHIDECANDYKRAVVVNEKDQYGRTCLHYATSLGELGSMEMIMIVGSDPRIKDIYGRTPLHYAGFQDKKEVVELLKLLFHKACKANEAASEDSEYQTIARLLKYKKLKKMAKIPKPNIYSIKTLPKTVTYLNYSDLDNNIQKHIERMGSADTKPQMKKVEVFGLEDLINNRDNLGRTALHLAVLCDKIGIIRALLDNGADPDIKDANGSRPLELSSSRLASSILISRMKNPKKIKIQRNFSIVENKEEEEGILTSDLLLMEEEQLISFVTPELNENYLHVAIKSRNLEAVQILLQRNFNPIVMNKFHWNAVHLSIKSNDLKIASLLIKGHEDTDKDKPFRFQKHWVLQAWLCMDRSTIEKYSIFHLALTHTDLEFFSWLVTVCKSREKLLASKSLPEAYLKHNFGKLTDLLEKKAKKEYTALLYAVKLDNFEAAVLCIENSCNLYCKNDKLQNVLHIASIQGNKKIVEYLIRADSDFNRLRSEKDIKDRLAKDFDITGRLASSYFHIWDYANQNNIERLKIVIVTKEFSINEQTPKKKFTALHVAVDCKHLNCIKLLVTMGADLSLKNNNGLTALDMAMSNEDYKFESAIIRLLRGEGVPKELLAFNSEPNLYLAGKGKLQRPRKLRCNDLSDSYCIPKFSGKHKRKSLEKETEELWFEIQKKLIAKNTTISELFKMMDADKDGNLTFVEFHGLIIWLGLSFKLDQIQNLAMVSDLSQSGSISYKSLAKRFQDLLYKQKLKSMTSSVMKNDFY